ncbi:MAG: cell division protein FtsL [Pseudomonadota bacterium]
MLRHGIAFLALAIIAIAGWAYNVNYNTMTALDRVSELRRQISGEREALQVLRVEWAWLNAPERLNQLAQQYEPQLGLVPLTPDALKHAALVPFPEGSEEPQDVVIPIIDRSGLVPVPATRPAAWRSE